MRLVTKPPADMLLSSLKKNIWFVAILVTLGFIGCIGVAKVATVAFAFDKGEAGHFTVFSVARFLWIGLLVYFTTRYKILVRPMLGFDRDALFRSVGFVVAFVLLGSIAFGKVWTFKYLGVGALSLYLLHYVLVAAAEELTFRGLVFSVLTKKYSFLISALISSFLFGIIHYGNLVNPDQTFDGITSQVILAFGIGMYFCGSLLRSGSLIAPIVIHFLFNVALGGGLQEIAGIPQREEVVESSSKNRIFRLISSQLI